MEAFLSRKRPHDPSPQQESPVEDVEGESTELKLALLSSLHPEVSQDILLDTLLECDGRVEQASAILLPEVTQAPPKKQKTVGHQAS